MEQMTLNSKTFDVIRLLGKDKGGYSYLVTDGCHQYVLKQIHHEPCSYYQFGAKLGSELRDYERLRAMCEMLYAADTNIDYNIVWRYFSWSNQTLAMIALWAASVYMAQQKKNFWITAIPATFMSAVSATYFMAAGECMGLLWTPMGIGMEVYYPIAVVVGIVFAVAMLALYLTKTKKYKTAALA